MLDEPAMWAAMAIHRIDSDAVDARRAMWGTARASLNTAKLVTLLIFLTVPPVYLLESFVPLIIGGPVIAGIALWKSVGLLGGSVLDEAYDKTDRAMRPLGLGISEHPEVTIEVKGVTPYRLGPTVRGALVLEGERHGHQVVVRMPSEGARSKSEVLIAVPTPTFEFRARDGRLRAEPGAPLAAGDLLQAVPNSTRWNGVRGGGGERGVVVTRKGASGGDWLLDLWLAERLTDALDRVPA